MNRALVLVIVIAVASGCASLTDSSPSDTRIEPANDTLNMTQTGEEHTVYYTSDGFQPEEITIEQGDTVTWINNASNTMWVGSDQHPSHTEYDGTSLYRHCSNGESDTFDQCSSGDRYSFTFRKTGSWGYHNHESPFDTGTVIVE